MNTDASPSDGSRQRTLAFVACLAIVGAIVVVALRKPAPAPVPTLQQRLPAVDGLLSALTVQQRTTSAGRVRGHCEGAVAEGCACARAAIHEALDASLLDQARALLTQGRALCGQTLSGQDAELLVRAGSAKQGSDAANAVLAAHHDDPYANYALAQANWAGGDAAATERFVQAAVAAGRGSPAHLLVGLMAFSRNEVEPARNAFERALESEPNDVPALYDVALSDHRLNHYDAARAGYLAVLKLNPRHMDARYNLALLTLGAGFREEAVHDLAELRAIAPPADPRVASLTAALAAAPPAPSASAHPSR